jgi:hypothetical protein
MPGPTYSLVLAADASRANAAWMTAPAVEVSWFGGPPNAHFFNASDGKWYQDAGLTIEATDDAIKFQAAIAYANAAGLGAVHFSSGNWYFKTKQATNEFVRLTAGNVTIYGDGDTSCIRVAPGFSTGASPVGYACLIGNADGLTGGAPPAVNNVRLTNFRADHNSAFNQWNSADFSGSSGLVSSKATAMLIGTTNFTVDGVTTENANGRFGIVAGTYGAAPAVGVDYTAFDVSIVENRFKNCGVDPNQGDSSFIAGGIVGGTVSGNRFVNDTFRPVPTAMEIHGRNCNIYGNSVDNMHRGCNLAGDSLDLLTFNVYGNTFTNVDTGFTLYSETARKIVGLKIHGNYVGLIKSTEYQSSAGSFYGGVTMFYGDGTAVGYGGGFFDVEITGNTIEWTDAVNVVPVNTYGVQWVGNTGGGSSNQPARVNSTLYTSAISAIQVGGFVYLCTTTGTSSGSPPSFAGAQTFGQTVMDGTTAWVCLGSVVAGGGTDISRNKITGMGAAGVQVTIGQAANTGNRLYDVHVNNNTIRDSGTYGVTVSGGSGDTNVQYKRLRVLDNDISDDRGGSSQLSIGAVCTGFTDSSCVIFGNDVFGYTSSAEFFDPTNYPTQSQFYPQRQFGSITANSENTTTGTVELVALSNTTAGTAGVPVQASPAYAMHGKYYASGASHDANMRIWNVPSAAPTLVVDSLIDGAGYSILMEFSLTQMLLACPQIALENVGIPTLVISALPQTAPATPAAGFTIYIDSADSKLKAKGTSGTVTILAVP